MSDNEKRWNSVEFPDDEVIDVTTPQLMSDEVPAEKTGPARVSWSGPGVSSEITQRPVRRKSAKKSAPAGANSRERVFVSAEVKELVETAWLRCLNEGRPMSRIEIIDLVFEKGFRKAFPDA